MTCLRSGLFNDTEYFREKGGKSPVFGNQSRGILINKSDKKIGRLKG